MSQRTRGLALVALVAVAGFLPCRSLVAEPYLALRTGLKCAQCHVNRTGGGGRNAFGSAWAQTQLPMHTVGIRSRSLSDWVSIGLDLRAVGSWNANVGDGLEGAIPRTAVEIPEAQIQLEARLIDDRLAFYVDQTMGPERAFAREAFGIVERLPLNGYAKVGKFMLPYGWRIWDDGAFIREETGFTFLTPDIGVEIGIEPGPLSWFVAISNGSVGTSEGNSDKMITSSAMVTFPRFRFGASASHNSGEGLETNIVGAFGGVSVGPFSVLGEVDLLFDSFEADPSANQDGFLAFVEGNLLVRRGLNLKVTHGFHDPTASVRSAVTGTAEDQRARTRVGVEAFPISFVQVAAFYTRLDNAGEPNDIDRLTLELHFHF
jgi:hypothetical protein